MNENENLFDMSEWRYEKEKGRRQSSELEKALNRLDDVEERLLRNLENKARRGESLTTVEYKMFLDLRAGLEQRQRASLESSVVKTAREVAIYFGRTERTIRNWAGRGMPQLPDGYDLKVIEEWGIREGVIKESRCENSQGQSEACLQGGDPGSMKFDRAYYETEIKRLDSELRAVRLQKETGAVMLNEKVEKEWENRAVEFKRDLLSRDRRLSLRGANKSAPELYEILREDALDMLRKYARGQVDIDSLEVPEDA